MTCQERQQYYKAREAYRRKCEDFREEIKRFFDNYKPRHYEQDLRIL